MYLKEITYYINADYPQFTPINYLFDREYLTEDEKALLISELPAIFKKYNIPLHHNDLLLYLNYYDNVATIFDINKILNSINSKVESERIDALLTKDFINFTRKISSYNCDKLIEKAINERYGYYYNKYDYDRVEKFKKCLDDNIPQNGFFNVSPLTTKDFFDCRMDLIDIKEQRFRDAFHTIKSIYPNTSIIFSSERYLRLYNILKEKYKELDFDKVSLDQGNISISKKISSLYVNDICYEEVPKHLCKGFIPSIKFNSSIFNDYPEQFRKHFSNKRYNRYLKKIDTFVKTPSKIEVKYTDNLSDVINQLEAERVILERNGYQDALSLLPVLFQDYFRFCLKYQKELSFFKKDLLKTSNREKSIKNMLDKFGKENIDSELIIHLLNNKSFNHNIIKKVKVYK